MTTYLVEPMIDQMIDLFRLAHTKHHYEEINPQFHAKWKVLHSSCQGNCQLGEMFFRHAMYLHIHTDYFEFRFDYEHDVLEINNGIRNPKKIEYQAEFSYFLRFPYAREHLVPMVFLVDLLGKDATSIIAEYLDIGKQEIYEKVSQDDIISLKMVFKMNLKLDGDRAFGSITTKDLRELLLGLPKYKMTLHIWFDDIKPQIIRCNGPFTLYARIKNLNKKVDKNRNGNHDGRYHNTWKRISYHWRHPHGVRGDDSQVFGQEAIKHGNFLTFIFPP